MEKKEKNNKFYFKNLDGLRFFAAFAVILGHCQSLLYVEHGGVDPYSPYASKLANFGVDFFFVLSGFLISYLTIVEIDKTGKLSIRHFYMRRVLRIFPLYFLFGIVALTLGKFFLNWVGYESNGYDFRQQAYTSKDYFTSMGFLFSFSINIQAMIGWHMGVSSLMVGHFWSLAVEEQFYLLWAPILSALKRWAWVAIVLFTVIGLYFCLLPPARVSHYTEFFINFTVNKFFQFGTGGLLALLIFHRIDALIFEKMMTFLTERLFFLAAKVSETLQKIIGILTPILGVLLIIAVLYCQFVLLRKSGTYLFSNKYYGQMEHIYNVAVSVAIIWTAVFEYSLLNYIFLESRPLKYLGKISFGIYIFHEVGIRATAKWLLDAGYKPQNADFQWLLPIISTLMAIALAALSFEFFEKRFLAMKQKFS